MDPSLLGQPIPVPTTQKPSRGINGRVIAFILAGLVAVVAGIFLLLNSGDNSGALQQRMTLREKALLEITKDGQKHIISPELRKINSEISILLYGHSARLDAAYKKSGVKATKDKAVVSDENADASLEKLKSAELNGQYDSVYKGVLTQHLTALNALGREFHNSTKSKSVKDALSAQFTDVAIYLKQLETLPPS